MDIKNLIASASEKELKEALEKLLEPHFRPVFGAAKQIEHEVAALRVLKLLKAIPAGADEYDLVTTLRVTKPKARALMYQEALRSEVSPEQIDQSLKELLVSPTVVRDGNMVLIEVPQPLIMDVLRNKIRKLGYLSDGSFSGSVARLPLKALAALVISYIPESEREKTERQLRKQGIEGGNLAGLIVGLLKKFGQSAAGAAGEQVGDKLGEGLNALLDLAWTKLSTLLKNTGSD